MTIEDLDNLHKQAVAWGWKAADMNIISGVEFAGSECVVTFHDNSKHCIQDRQSAAIFLEAIVIGAKAQQALYERFSVRGKYIVTGDKNECS